MATTTLSSVNTHSSNTSGEYYSRNNQFQISGPKGFMEHRILENNDLFVRIDLPGVTKESVTYTLDNAGRMVFFEGVALVYEDEEEEQRVYLGSTGLICKCCELVPNVSADVRDGVLRMVFQKKFSKKKKPPCSSCAVRQTQVALLVPHATLPSPSVGVLFRDSPSSNLSDESGSIIDDHPYVWKGSKKSFQVKNTSDGGLFVRVDMPGVAKEDSRVWFLNGEVKFVGRARPITDHELGARDYLGSVSLQLPPNSCLKGNIQYEMKNGVLRINVPPPVALLE